MSSSKISCTYILTHYEPGSPDAPQIKLNLLIFDPGQEAALRDIVERLEKDKLPFTLARVERNDTRDTCGDPVTYVDVAALTATVITEKRLVFG